jgi:hypothetical protein
MDMGIEVARRGLHHHRFLERAIVRVPITTLWQPGYTVKKCPPFGQTRPDEGYKMGAYIPPPRARPHQLGEEPCGVWVRGDGPNLIALGAVPVR